MRLAHLVAVPALSLSIAAVALAQDAQPAHEPSIGIGIDQSTTLYVPIRVAPHIRLEPTISLIRRADASASQFVSGNTVENEADTARATDSEIGLGVQFEHPLDRHVRAYFGPRLGLTFLHAKESFAVVSPSAAESVKDDRTDFFGALVLGGEYLLGRHFSIGAEGQLQYVHHGKDNVTYTGTQGVQGIGVIGDPTLSTRGVFLIRFYM